MRRVATSAVALTALAFVMLVAACGGSSTSKSSSSGSTTTASSGGGPSTDKSLSAASTTTASSGGVDPNAPEVVAPGDIPDTQVFIPFAGPGGGYSLKVPEGWSQSTVGTTATLTDHYNTVMAATGSVATAPTATSVQATEVPMLRREVSNFELVKVETVTRKAGSAVLVRYRAGSAPDAVTGKRVALDVERYEFWRNGTQVTLTLSGARGSDNVDPWKTITNSFAWTA